MTVIVSEIVSHTDILAVLIVDRDEDDETPLGLDFADTLTIPLPFTSTAL